jgi:hypothetical protein
MSMFSVEEWEIWYTFSTYINRHVNNLSTVGKRLLELEIADCVVMSDGYTFCRSDKGIVSGKTVIKLSNKFSRASISFESDSNFGKVKFTPYAQRSWLIGAQFLYGEARQFSQGRELPDIHLRAFFRPIQLVKSGERISIFYPVALLYKSGIVIIEFRTLSPDKAVNINDFIENYINLSRDEYDFALVPSSISAMAPEIYHLHSSFDDGIFSKLSFLKNRRNHREAVKSASKKFDIGDFNFDMAPISSNHDEETIVTVAQTLSGILGFLSVDNNSILNLCLKGTSILPDSGGYWILRPHIYILRHTSQMHDASRNEQINKDDFGRIIARVSSGGRNFSEFLPPSSRPFNDYACYITFPLTLWVWSKKAVVDQQEFIETLIYENQVKVELLEYGFMLHKSLLDKLDKFEKYSEILATRRDLSILKSKMFETTPYGEIRDLLTQGWEQMGLNLVRDQISENLSILESEIKFVDSEKSDRFKIFITVFSLIASASLAKSVVSPLWIALNLWIPADKNWSELFLAGISAMLIVFLILLLRSAIYRRIR